MSNYRVAINLELTSKCNARCVMCPREALTHPRIMTLKTLSQAVDRLNPEDVFRVVLAGYGEPTTHPKFDECMQIISQTPVRVDMVSNGQLLDLKRLQLIDGLLDTLIISFSSIDPEVYSKVHVNLDQVRVMDNIILAQRTLRSTKLAISLTPLSNCIATLPQTINWLRDHGVEHLSMSPSLYDRAGSMDKTDPQEIRLRKVIRQYGLHSQELDFVPSAREIFSQWCGNRFKCIPRNSDLVIAADGSYQFCFNDISHSHPMGQVADISIREVLKLREGTTENPSLCANCGIRDRYRPAELISAAFGYWRSNIG